MCSVELYEIGFITSGPDFLFSEVQYDYETECEKQFYYNGYDAGACFQPLYSLQSFVGQATYATYLSGISEDDIRNKESAARDGTQLKCR